MPANSPVSQPNLSGARILSAFELLLGAFIVIGHNVFHIVPNEVPILFVLGLVSIRILIDLHSGDDARFAIVALGTTTAKGSTSDDEI